MADFDQGYYHSMDREYRNDALMPIKDIGVSIMATKDALQPLVAKIREGASKVEIGFLGAGKGSIFSGNINPESIDKEQREAIRLLAKVNKVELSTHATVATGGFAGLSNRGFDDGTRIANLNEIKRAIEFAADTAQGGAVTMHAQEFPRPLFNIEGKDSGVKFLAHPSESEDAVLPLVDARTGEIIQSVRKNLKIQMPVYETDADGKPIVNKFGNYVPKIEEVKDKDGSVHHLFKTEEWDWKKIEEETARRNASLAKDKQLKPEQVYHVLQAEASLKTAKGEEIELMKDYDLMKERRERVVEALEKWKAVEDAAGSNKERLKDDFRDDELPRDLVLPKQGLPTERLQRAKEILDRQLASIEQKGIAQRERIRDFEKTMDNIKPLSDFAVEKSTDSIARVGMYAYDVEKQKGLKKDLFVAPEGIFPDRYGSHPQELKNLIIESRRKMAETLQKERGMSESAARDVAERHIKATVDVGHVNVWRKYFQQNPGESIDQANKRFNNWLLSEMKDLNKSKIIGHLHISDNFGYEDEHLTPGQGSAPIKEFVKLMKEAGVTDMVVEPGAQDPAKQYEALYGGWKLFGHSIYGVSAPGKKSLNWGDIQHNYFGQNNPPYFLFGELALSEEYRGSPFWSGLGLE